uniref:TF-B3 domain-containing protein n=1 Tax=Leersia perrieri TaxID=77586 RepID=A0A0D9UXT5_9ORYZ
MGKMPANGRSARSTTAEESEYSLIITGLSTNATTADITIAKSPDGRYNLTEGWKEFITKADIKEGQTCAFHLYKKNGKVELMVMTL